MKDLKIEEKKYKQLRKLGQELHIPIPETFLELEVFDKDGKIIQRHKQRSHSWVRNAYNQLISQLASKGASDASPNWGGGFINIKDTGGIILSHATRGICITTSTAHEMQTAGYGYHADATINTFGIQVGSGTNIESFEDYALQTLIGNGTGAGQLSYAAMEVPAKSYDAVTKVLTITRVRYLNNNTAPPGDVSVKEIALTTNGKVGDTPRQWVMSRDKLGATVTIPATGQLKISYVLSLAYPA